MNQSQKTAILEIMSGLWSVAAKSTGNPALNDGDYSGYHLLGCVLGRKVAERAKSESIEPTENNPDNWMDGWVYAYHDPKKLLKELGL